MSALIFGEALVDMLVTHKARSMYSIEAYPGGSPANTAAALSALGIETSFITLLGRDIFADLITSRLEEFGVDLSYSIVEGEDTLLAVVHVDSEGIPKYSFRQDEGVGRLESPLLEYPLTHFQLIHTGSLALLFPVYRKIFLPLFERALSLGLCTSLDPNIRRVPGIDTSEYRKILLSLMERVHLVKASEEDLFFLFGEEYLEKLREVRGDRATFITKGDKGSYVLLGEEEASIPPQKVEVVDTTGCGDAYMGGVLSYLLKEEEWDFKTLLEAGRKGSSVAGEVACYPGALEGLKNLGCT